MSPEVVPRAGIGAAARRRLFLVGALVVAGAALAVLAFGNIGQNLVYYWNPTELHEAGDRAVGATIRLGGLVKQGSVDWRQGVQELRFEVTDGHFDVPVHATATPPQMFREGQGVVVEGTMSGAGVFEAERLMVKHSNEYRAPKEGEDPLQVYKTVEGL